MDYAETPEGKALAERAITKVRTKLRNNDDHEVDDTPRTSIAEDGVWVETWVWVPNKSAAED